jgi:hypothetical protein
MSKEVEEAGGKIAEDVKPVIPDDDDKAADIPEGFSSDEWNDLSDEEREGVLATGDEGPDGGSNPDGEKKEEAATPPVPEVPAEVQGEATPAASEEGGAEPGLESFDDETAPKIPTVPLSVSNDVPADLKARIDELAEKFDEGELSVREYTDQRDALNREVWQRNLQTAQEAQAAKTWEAEQAYFLAKNPAYTEDSLRGNALFGMLDAAVRTLAADPANADKSGYQVLQMAHKEVVGIVKGAASVPKETPLPSVPTTGAKPKAAKPNIVTLGDVPASAANVGENPFAAIDRLDGEAYEAALERMTPDQLKSYRARL